MFKAAVPSVAPSASASASSHDTHSLPPAFKGPVQRFLAVSLPTVTLTPEFIDILDSVDVIIPSRVQVTIRWWNEDTASSLAVFPKLNSPLPPSVEVHQALLRKQHLDKKNPHQPQQPEPKQQDQKEQLLSSIASNSALPSLTTAPQLHSMAAKFLRRPWTTGGARLMNVLRIGNNKKSKEDNPSSSKTPLATQDTDARKGNQQPQDHHAVEDTLPPKNRQRQDVQPVPKPIPTLQPTTPNPLPHAAAALADAKPLPTLPDAAYPVTVAYPVRCSLDQLYRYFLEMTSLSLEIQITPNLTILASVTNLADLFRNIHGTFSGVFPFTTVLQNNDPNLAHHDIFNRRTVLGMAVFQAWCQDTSDVGDTSEGSDSTSNESIHNDERSTALHHHHHHHRSHNGQGSIRHHRQPSYQHFGHPTEHSSISYHPPPQQHPLHQQQQMHRVRPSLGVPSKQPPPVHPLSPSAVVDPTVHHQQQQKVPQLQRGARIIDRRPLVGPRHPDSHLYYQSSLRFDDEPATYRHRRFPSHPHPNAIGPSQMPYENQNHRGSRGGGNGRQQGMAGAAGVGSIGSSSHQYPNIKLPIPDLRPPYDASYRRHARNGVQRPSQDDSLYRHRRSEDTNTTTHYSQGSRSRPRSGATASAIGRLDSVLARGEDLLQGMKTSLALDPEEVRTRSARHLRSSVLKDDHQDDSRFRPYHESLPYWPSKSRFKLELSIPTAYLTSHGLLKGSKHKKYHPLPLPEQQQPHSKQQRQDHHQSQQQQQQQQQRSQSITPTVSSTAAGLVVAPENLTRSPRLIRQSGRGSRGQEFWTSMMGGGGHRREDSYGEGSESTPMGLKRSEKPIQFEKIARKSDLARLQLAQEQSAATAHGHYQSFQTSPDSSSRQYRQENHHQDRQGTRRRRSSSGSRRKDGPSSSSLPGHQQPRKSKSYPPETFPTMGADPGRLWKQQHRRRLSSNDRLQIRMNPRPGDLLNDTPDLFPSRSMSGLVRPEYHSSVTGSSFSGAEDNHSTGQSYSVSTEDEDLRYGGAMGGRQSRLQRRRKVPSVEEEEDVDEEVERVNQQRRRRERSQDRRKESRRRQRRNKDKGRGFGHEQGPGKRPHGVHPQHFNFKAQCQLMLTPEVMAACMLENISVEVWKLNPKRQTMIELGSAKLPLHKVLSRILQKTAAASASGSGGPHGSTRGNLWGGPGGPQDSYYGSGSAARMREWQQQQRGGEGGARAAGTFKEGWRLEPSLYDIRSRQGTVIGQLDADVWILPRSRSDSMVSAAA